MILKRKCNIHTQLVILINLSVLFQESLKKKKKDTVVIKRKQQYK